MRTLVVADDLTGANDTGSAFARRGRRTVISLAKPDAIEGEPDADVAVVNTDSRYVDPDTAGRRVRGAVDAAGAETVYKKIDSTLRGNLVAEIDAAMDVTGADVAIVAPAFPGTGRITVGCHHLVNGVPVAESPAGRDPKGPATSHLPTLLADSSYPVVHQALDAVSDHEQLSSTLDDLVDAGDRALVVCDATTEAHLATVAQATATSSADAVYVGSAGLAGHVRTGTPNTVLGVAGSVAPETLDQLDALQPARVVELGPERAVTDPDAAVDRALEEIQGCYETGDWAVVTAATEPADVDVARRAGHDKGLDEQATGEQIADTLAAVARAVHREQTLDGLFVTGGEVATTTFDALGAERIQLLGHQVAAGVPLGQIEGGEADGLVCLTKAGAFGDDTAILNGLHFLARYDD